MIDVYATQVSYLRHLLPIYDALPRGLQGNIYTEMNQYELARSFDHSFRRGRPDFESTDPVLIAGGTDIMAGWSGRPVVFVEHGSGQTYADHTSVAYSGGQGRDQVRMFLSPNRTVADRNLAAYPDVPSFVVGDPSIPGWALGAAMTPDDPTIAFTWHWEQHSGPPEAQATWPYWQRAVENVVKSWTDEGVQFLGHCHPRCGPEIREWWAAMNLPFASSLDDVHAKAHLLVADNTSAMFEYAATGRPVLVLNAPSYRRDVEHGLRFWEFADVGVQCDDQADFTDRLLAAMTDPPGVNTRRTQITEALYPYIGTAAAERAVGYILERWGR